MVVGSCVATNTPGARFTVGSDGVVTDALGASSKGLVGADYETLLAKNLGGQTNITYVRQFDVEVPGGNGMRSTLIEANSGNFWNQALAESKVLGKFQSTVGQQLSIAQARGSNFFVYSNTPIPASIQSWLNAKGIGFRIF